MKKDKSQKQLTLVESLTRGGEKKNKQNKQTNKQNLTHLIPKVAS
jgi:hypothetical protein